MQFSQISTGESLLREYVSCLFPGAEVKYNFRPRCLEGLELDIYLPAYGLALEFNGDQHYIDTDTFGSCRDQVTRDKRKRYLCKRNNIYLVVIEAIDLEYTKLRSKIRGTVRGESKKTFMPTKDQDEKKMKEINKRATAYRKSLIEKYDSPTARMKRKNPRKQAFENHKRKGGQL